MNKKIYSEIKDFMSLYFEKIVASIYFRTDEKQISHYKEAYTELNIILDSLLKKVGGNLNKLKQYMSNEDWERFKDRYEICRDIKKYGGRGFKIDYDD